MLMPPKTYSLSKLIKQTLKSPNNEHVLKIIALFLSACQGLFIDYSDGKFLSQLFNTG